jgi:DNA-binding transcriptional LysR family regulator
LTQLSELGRLMLPLLEQSLAMAEAAKQRADKFKKGEEATLRLGLPSTIFTGTATPILAEVVRRLPALEVGISAKAQNRIIEKLLQGELDVAFLVDDGELPKRFKT